MSYLDKPIPTLEGEVTERFLEMARQNEEGANKIDFSEQIKSFEKIMEKSPLEGVNNNFVDPEMMHMSFVYCMNFGGPKIVSDICIGYHLIYMMRMVMN